jgi:2-keto-4-pentenoate hydratase/2-oxohepta-3-ene-1,7-dioic acid hydratase in catechol pathway
MKLVRFGPPGDERPGILDPQGRVRDLSAVVEDWAEGWLSRQALDRIACLDLSGFPVVDPATRLGPCVGKIGKLIGIGLNYSDHAAESGMPVPAEPVVFFKAVSAVCGPFDDVEIPRDSFRTDWEVELGVVIGKRAKYIELDQALHCIAGYCVVNDLSEREFQLEMGGQWVKGKSHDTFAPLGPWLVTADEIPDPQALELWMEVDGVRRQHSSTSRMVFGVLDLICYLSRFMTLLPGDVITTGTPPGVGMGCKPPDYLREGQVMRLGVEGLGVQQQRTVAWRA